MVPETEKPSKLRRVRRRSRMLLMTTMKATKDIALNRDYSIWALWVSSKKTGKRGPRDMY